MNELPENIPIDETEELIFTPASMWKRLGAFFIDIFIFLGFTLLMWFILMVTSIVLSINLIDENGEGIAVILAVIIEFLYFSLMESSKSQATLGKIALNIIVTDYNGERISYGRAALRFLSKYISAGLFYLGYLMGFLTEYTQMLHDKIAKTYVLDASPVKMDEEVIDEFSDNPPEMNNLT